MKAKNTLILIPVFLFMLFLQTGCKKNETDDNHSTPIEAEIRTGKLAIVPGSTVSAADLKVLTLLSSSALDADGSFSVSANKAEKFQILLFADKTSDAVCYLGLYDPLTQNVMANDTSTALALLLLNPNLMFTTQDVRKEYLEVAKLQPKFADLIQELDKALTTQAVSTLDFQANPSLFQLVAEVIEGTMEILESKNEKSTLFGGEPTIEDISGDGIVFVNPRHVNYGVGIYPENQSLKEVITAGRQKQIIELFTWPPTFNEPQRTEYALGDGTFLIHLHKGYDFTNMHDALDFNHPIGRGTWTNTGEAILQLFDVIAGLNLQLGFASLPSYLHITSDDGWKFYRDISQHEYGNFLIHFMVWIGSNSEGIAYWFFQEGADVSAHAFISQIAGLIANVGLAFKLLNFANGPGPFFYDMCFAPQSLNYYITQANGVILTNEMNSPPEPAFTISPPAGIVTTLFTFDGSASTDDVTPLSQLMLRWDFESDGIFDTEWSNNLSTTHTFSTSGSFQVTLQVKDENDLLGYTTHNVNVGGGGGTANHVKLFMDVNPWESTAMIDMLNYEGFTVGSGPNTYEIIPSSEMGTVPLVPGVDLVIISNDQDQTFYDNYGQNQVRFANFIYTGGSVLWEACDNGWNYGTMAQAGIILPGNITPDYKLDYYNFVTDQNLPLVAGLPYQMDHNYASHERFIDLPEGTTVYCVDSDSEPTLIEYNLGGGWIIISGQPLEHQYDWIYGSPDMEQLLPRIVAYFTGKEFSMKNGFMNHSPIPSAISSAKRK